MKNQKYFTIRKKIAKHGKDAVIVIPKILKEDLPGGTVVELFIRILKEAKVNGK